MKKIILAYSGGLDTSVMIPWLKEQYNNISIITVTVDVGQDENLSEIKKKAIKSGAEEAYVIDAKKEFITEYLYPLIKSGALYEENYILGTISRPLIALKLIEIAKQKRADFLVHGATGKGNDQVRFESTIMALAPHLKIIAPWREWQIKSRQEAIEYAKKHNIEVPLSPKSPYSRDRNIWYISHEGGVLENVKAPAPNNLLLMTTPVEKAPDTPDVITLGIVEGIPVSINGIKKDPIVFLAQLNKLAGKHGIGVSDIIESRLVGMKIRGVYEAPAAAVIYKAHHILESVCLDKDILALKQSLKQKYAQLVYNGQWVTQSREVLDTFFNSTQKNVTGSVKLKLYKGNVIFQSVESQFSLYKHEFATFEEDDVYTQADAEGFINIFSLSSKIYGLVHNKGDSNGK